MVCLFDVQYFMILTQIVKPKILVITHISRVGRIL